MARSTDEVEAVACAAVRGAHEGRPRTVGRRAVDGPARRPVEPLEVGRREARREADAATQVDAVGREPGEDEVAVGLGVDLDVGWRVHEEEPVLVAVGGLARVGHARHAAVDRRVGGELAGADLPELLQRIVGEPDVVVAERQVVVDLGPAPRSDAEGEATRGGGRALDAVEGVVVGEEVAVEVPGVGVADDDGGVEVRSVVQAHSGDAIGGGGDRPDVDPGHQGDADPAGDADEGVAQRAEPSHHVPAAVAGLDVGDARQCRRGAARERSRVGRVAGHPLSEVVVVEAGAGQRAQRPQTVDLRQVLRRLHALEQ